MKRSFTCAECPCTKSAQGNVWMNLINCLVKSNYLEPKVVNLNEVNFVNLGFENIKAMGRAVH